jgi:hypothetical protein
MAALFRVAYVDRTEQPVVAVAIFGAFVAAGRGLVADLRLAAKRLASNTVPRAARLDPVAEHAVVALTVRAAFQAHIVLLVATVTVRIVRPARRLAADTSPLYAQLGPVAKGAVVAIRVRNAHRRQQLTSGEQD